jgi:iron complex outermembrane receptor protein
VGIPNDFAHVQLIGEARSQGPELDIQGEIWPGWTVNLAYANTDAITTKTNTGNASTPPIGSPAPYVPRNQGSVASNYEFKEGVLKRLKVGVRYDYTGYLPFYHWDNASTYIYGWGTPSYGLVGLFAGYDFSYDKLKVHAQLNVDNLFNINYFNAGGFGWIPGYLPGFAAPTITPGFANNPDNVFGAPRTIRGLIKVAF